MEVIHLLFVSVISGRDGGHPFALLVLLVEEMEVVHLLFVGVINARDRELVHLLFVAVINARDRGCPFAVRQCN